MGFGTLAFQAVGRRRPLNVMLSVTDRCTGLCHYCKIPLRKSPEMTLDQITALFGEMRRAGTARIAIWGGEPLIRDDIGGILEAARKQGFYVSVDTNGVLVPEKMDVIPLADHFVVALDGREENHDANRTAGSHKAALKALEILVPRTRVWTITVLTKHNLGDIDHILETARTMGFMASFQVLHHNEHLGVTAEDLVPEDNAVRQAIKKLIRAKISGAPIANTIQYLKFLRGWPDFSEPTSLEQVGRLSCVAGDLFANIDTNGDLYPCSLTVGKVPVRNVLKEGFENAFRATSRMGCRSCDASCYVEYNHIHALHPGAIWDFARSVALKG